MDDGSKSAQWDITNLLNKLAVLSGEAENLVNNLRQVLDVMTDDTPENDLHQDVLEALIFASRQKISNFKIRFDDADSHIKDLFSDNKVVNLYGNKVSYAKEIILKLIGQSDELVKNISSTSMKWEVGASEVIKSLRNRISEQGKNISRLTKKVGELETSIKDIIRTFGSAISEMDDKTQKVDERLDIIGNQMTPIKLFKEFRENILKVAASDPTTKSLVKFN